MNKINFEEEIIHDAEGLMWLYVLKMFKEFPVLGYETKITITQTLEGKWKTNLWRYKDAD